jgi:hypothetical protein
VVQSENATEHYLAAAPEVPAKLDVLNRPAVLHAVRTADLWRGVGARHRPNLTRVAQNLLEKH